MIFTERQITVHKGKSSINEPVILYRGDYEVSIKFTIMESKFRFKSGVNLVDSEKASHGQLAILAPYGGNVFSDIVKCEDGTVTFTLTKEMIDQLEEVGLYSFQIRLFDYYRESRVSIPPVEFGIEVREPVASEDHDNSVNNAIVGYSIAKVVDGLNEDVPDTFDANDNYNKTDWETGDRITEGKLNKIEDALDKINQNEKNDVAALDKRVTNNFNVLNSNKADKNEIFSMSNMGQDVKEAMTGGSVAVIGNNMVNMGQMTSNIQDDIGKWVDKDFTLNSFGYNATTGLQDDSMDDRIMSWEMDISSGDRLKISGFTFGSPDCCIMFLDGNGTIISKIGEDNWGTPVDYEFTCPYGTSKVKMNCWSNNANKTIEKFEYMGIVNKEDFKVAEKLQEEDIKFISNIRNQFKDYKEISYTQYDFAYGIKDGKPYLYENGGAGNSNTVIDVSIGEVYKIDMTTISTTSAYTIILTNSNDNVISSIKANKTLTEETFIVNISGNVSKMYVSFRRGLCVINKEIILDIKDIDKDKDNIPEFYKEHLENKINEINKNEDNYGTNGTTIGFITDIHYPDNKMYSIDMLKKITENTNLEMIISGGDNLRDNEDKAKSRLNIREFMRIVKTKLGDKFYNVYGNHDNNSNQENIFTRDEVYSMYFKQQEKRVITDKNNLKGLYWYKDDEVQKIRYIALNSFEGTEGIISVEQMKWLCEEALNLPSDGWYLAFFTHPTMSIYQTGTMSEVRGLLNAIRFQTNYSKNYTDYNNNTYNINKDFSGKKHSVLFAIAGHNHIDRLQEDNGIYYVQTICDATYRKDDTVPSRQDINLQCFDIITINKTTNIVNLTRVGAGEDRSFTFINNNA